jgi:hypothetical protein
MLWCEEDQNGTSKRNKGRQYKQWLKWRNGERGALCAEHAPARPFIEKVLIIPGIFSVSIGKNV